MWSEYWLSWRKVILTNLHLPWTLFKGGGSTPPLTQQGGGGSGILDLRGGAPPTPLTPPMPTYAYVLKRFILVVPTVDGLINRFLKKL